MYLKNYLKPLLIFVTLCCCLVASAQEMRQVSAHNLFIIETSEGNIYIEMAPEFAPQHVARIKQLNHEKAYHNTQFYRVIEGFVAQGGPGDALDSEVSPLPLEAEHKTQKLQYALVQTNDLFAPFTAFSQGFAIALNQDKSQFWLTHCPGVVAMARGNEADSATSDFYITIGQAPRYLDKIMTIFGRVVYGMDVVQRTRRGVVTETATFENALPPTEIIATYFADELPEKQRPKIKVEKTGGAVFTEKLQTRKHRTHPFFFKPPPAVLDVCQVPLTVEFEAPEAES